MGKSNAAGGVDLSAVSSAVAAALAFTLVMPTALARNVLIAPFAAPSRLVMTLTDIG